MLQKSDNSFDRRWLRRTTWLALVSLAWLQVTLASHQLQHVAVSFADTCDVCVQLDRTDDVAAGQPAPVATTSDAAAPEGHLPTAAVRPKTPRHFDSRAPPHL
jgi:hypothetical protein